VGATVATFTISVSGIIALASSYVGMLLEKRT